MNFRILVLSVCCVLVFSALSVSPWHTPQASAHISQSFGQYIVQVGWNNEPALTDQMNAIQVTVVKGSHIDTGQPVINALANMKTSVKFGTMTEPVDFLPSPTTNGQYLSSLVPTEPGTYDLVLSGTIEGQTVDADIQLDQVGSIDTVQFPPTTSGSSGSGNTASNAQVGNIVNQLTNDINDAKNTANNAAQSYSKVAQSFQDVKNTTDGLYIISMVGIGIGAAGVVVAVMSITRKNQLTSY